MSPTTTAPAHEVEACSPALFDLPAVYDGAVAVPMHQEYAPIPTEDLEISDLESDADDVTPQPTGPIFIRTAVMLALLMTASFGVMSVGVEWAHQISAGHTDHGTPETMAFVTRPVASVIYCLAVMALVFVVHTKGIDDSPCQERGVCRVIVTEICMCAFFTPSYFAAVAAGSEAAKHLGIVPNTQKAAVALTAAAQCGMFAGMVCAVCLAVVSTFNYCGSRAPAQTAVRSYV